MVLVPVYGIDLRGCVSRIVFYDKAKNNNMGNILKSKYESIKAFARSFYFYDNIHTRVSAFS